MARLPLVFPPRIEALRPSRLAAAVLGGLLPPSCLSCGEAVDAAGSLCGACFGALTLIDEACCACCGTPFKPALAASEGGLCGRCLDAPPAFSRARAAMVYDAASRQLILPFKHGDRMEFAPLLARLMARAGADLLRECDLIVPVPLHRRRLFSRRYNQAALLARALGQLSGRTVLLDALRRIVATGSLGGRSAFERRDTVAGVFAVRSSRADALRHAQVLLVDDVMTSGATTNECANCLLEAGAASVKVLVASRVPEPPRDGQPRWRRGRWRHRRFATSDPRMKGQTNGRYGRATGSE